VATTGTPLGQDLLVGHGHPPEVVQGQATDAPSVALLGDVEIGLDARVIGDVDQLALGVVIREVERYQLWQSTVSSSAT
jgi:hypothetical protein